MESGVQGARARGAGARGVPGAEDVRFLRPLPALDGVRAAAVTGTFAMHLVPGLVPAGFVGVDVFFVLSGFLITSLLLGEHARSGGLDLRRFYVRRLRRLYPALLALLVVYATWALVADPADLRVVHLVTTAANALYVANWAGVTGHEVPWQVDHLWSLDVEEQFYVAIPVLLLLALRRGLHGRRLGRAFLVLAALCTAADVASWQVWHAVNVSYLATPLHAAGLFTGCALAVAYVHRTRDGLLERLAASRWVPAACLAALVVLALTCGLDSWTAYWVAIPGASALAAVLVAALALPEAQARDLVRRALRSRAAVAIGRRSYSLYLWQNFVQWALTGPLHHAPLVVWIGVNVAVSAVLAELSHRFVEHLLHPRRA